MTAEEFQELAKKYSNFEELSKTAMDNYQWSVSIFGYDMKDLRGIRKIDKCVDTEDEMYNILRDWIYDDIKNDLKLRV